MEESGGFKRLTVVIPAYRPEMQLIDVVDGLLALNFMDILIVDDGSGQEYRPLFNALREMRGVEVIENAINLGKGAALKNAFNHVLVTRTDLIGVVTVDADGQHLACDVHAIANCLVESPRSLVLGTREMNKDVPFRSRFGNELTARVFHFLVGHRLIDTQTGLRGIPVGFLPALLRIPAQRYEFELEMLINTIHNGMEIVEHPITTVYEDGNRTSHFSPLLDSLRIYFVFLRFSLASLLIYFTDLIVFSISILTIKDVLASLIVGRLSGAVVGFFLAKNFVFHKKIFMKSSVLKFGLVWLMLLGMSYFMILAAVDSLGINVYVARAVADFLLFFMNFFAQRAFVFAETDEE